MTGFEPATTRPPDVINQVKMNCILFIINCLYFTCKIFAIYLLFYPSKTCFRVPSKSTLLTLQIRL